MSAYALIVEEGTRLAGRIRRGELPMPDDDVLADDYLLADEVLAAAGFAWYEVSNWATTPAARCRHNIGYWTSDDWWGAGPGAHSHVGGVRWWNVKHPAAYAAGWRTVPRRRMPARCSAPRTGGWSGSCSRCGLPRAARPRCSEPTALLQPPASRPTACSTRLHSTEGGRC